MFQALFGMGLVGFILGILASGKLLSMMSKAVHDLTEINKQIVHSFYNYRDEVKKFIDQAEEEVRKIRDLSNKK